MKMTVFHMLSRLLLEGCPLIAIHKVRYYKRGDGLALGPGPFVTALEFASDVKAEVVGKPQPSFFQQALEEIGCDAHSAVMIGDVSQAWKLVFWDMYLALFLIQVFKCQFPFVIVVKDGQRDFEEEGELYIWANELLPIGEKAMPLQNNTKNRKIVEGDSTP